ncbi:MAG: hypothetical protein HC828_05060, partial [Blastochloris sp.]|nr:hypothetical protein [Blastochloris sp.]
MRGLSRVEIGNRSDTCSYAVGGAIYVIPSGDPQDPDIDSQIWFDDATTTVAPGTSETLDLAVPECAAVQQDAFWGDPLKSLDGQRYGPRLLAADRYHTGVCEPTPVPPTATPEPDQTTATPEPPIDTPPTAIPVESTQTPISPTSTPTAPPLVQHPPRQTAVPPTNTPDQPTTMPPTSTPPPTDSPSDPTPTTEPNPPVLPPTDAAPTTTQPTRPEIPTRWPNRHCHGDHGARRPTTADPT